MYEACVCVGVLLGIPRGDSVLVHVRVHCRCSFTCMHCTCRSNDEGVTVAKCVKHTHVNVHPVRVYGVPSSEDTCLMLLSIMRIFCMSTIAGSSVRGRRVAECLDSRRNRKSAFV